MKTLHFHLEVIALIVLSIIPWPGPSIFKISCPRESATIVRRVIQKKWVPVLDKYGLKMPMECPFHPKRDVFYPQEVAKERYRATQWTCGLCGKSFYSELYLDMHFDNRHRNHVNMGEDAVCLAEYCDIVRCEVVGQAILEEAGSGGAGAATDVEVWRDGTYRSTSLVPAAPRALAVHRPPPPPTTHSSVQPIGGGAAPPPVNTREEEPEDRCSPEMGDSTENCSSAEGGRRSDSLVDSALPPKQSPPPQSADVYRLKANCRPDDLEVLRSRCQLLVRDCIAGLLVNLSTQDFKDMEEELNQALCWYLTCDRYWEDSPNDARLFPWGLLFTFVMALSLFICLCYYIVWVLFDADDMSIGSTSATASSSPAHQSLTDEHYYPVGDDIHNEHYIYVTYPPDLKRRLLERYSGR